MECNKEEAIRARDIAASKMQNKDYVGARKIAHRAQQLFPGLENISQILSVCDVHCAAEIKLGGFEKDWYRILQVDITADDNAIRKQYRKLALLLHPDKNKFWGAEAGFKLIGEAQRNLLDKQKRMEHNKKRNAAFENAFGKRHTQPVNVVQQNCQTNHVMMSRPQNSRTAPQQQQDLTTFWTWCPFCGTQYQYYKFVIGRAIRCPNCLKPFIAQDVNTHGGPGSHTLHEPRQPPIYQEGEVCGVNTQNVDQQSAARNSSNGNLGAHVGTKTAESEFPRKHQSSTEAVSGTRSNLGADEIKVQGYGLEGKVNGTHILMNRQMVGGTNIQRKEAVISSEGKKNVEATVEFNSAAHKNKTDSSYCPRRSERTKQHVEYSEQFINVDEDEDLVILRPKRSKIYTPGSEAASYENAGKPENEANTVLKNGVPNGRLDEQANRFPQGERDAGSIKETTKMHDNLDRDFTVGRGADSQNVITYLEPEFYDFDQDRTKSSFRVDQMWSLYDDQEGMPRFYAMIKQIVYSPFKLYFTWLEHRSTSVNSTDCAVKVRVACGTFNLGDAGTSDNVSMFSHLVSAEKATATDTYYIQPKKDDVWALFKNWKDHKNGGFEIVEILSDYIEGQGVQVARLMKVKGFVSLFQLYPRGMGVDTFRIAPEEMQRFSHKIPIYRLSGKERKGLPQRSVELDPAALPAGLEEFEPMKLSENLKVEDQALNHGPETASAVLSTAPHPEPFELPASEFHDFETKSVYDFRHGQFWALYSEEDGMPKYYAHIENVDTESFSISVRWFEVVIPAPKEVSRWSKMGLPIGCGNFQLGSCDIFDTAHTFSHQVYPVQFTKLKFAIYPRRREVWAVFKNWTPGWSLSDVVGSKYKLVEIQDVSVLEYKVVVLEKVWGYRYVYKAVGSEKVIPKSEMLRFSHQVPAFRLTDERGGKLRGLLEVDPAAIPERLS